MKIPDLKLKKPKLQLKRKPSAGAKPGVKAPKFAADLYGDLRDRRLLPLVALLIVATIATPFLLAKDGPEEPVAVATGSTLALPASQASFPVAPAAPQLRDYHRRLGHREARNPFEEPPPAPKPSAESESEGSGGGKTESTPSESPVVKGGGSEAKTKVVVKDKVIGYEIDTRAGFVGFVKPRDGIEPTTKLPSPQKPVIVFIGLSKDKKGALFLMSSNVTAYYGKAHCTLDKQACQVVELRPGKSATFAYGYGEARYKLALKRIVAVVDARKVEATVTGGGDSRGKGNGNDGSWEDAPSGFHFSK
jgi:hypothetical protein